MPVFISMLRGVNVGAHNRIKMDALKVLYESLGFKDARTYVQSGNVIFRAREQDLAKLAKKIQDGIAKRFSFTPSVVVRTKQEMRAAMEASPFRDRGDIEPGKLLVTFLSGAPPAGAEKNLSDLKGYPEELHLRGRELYIYFPNGAGKSKLPWSQVDKLVGVSGTARNWNSVTKMLEMAEQMEAE